MRPTFHHLLELARLSANFELERIPAIGKNAQVYVGSENRERPVRGAPEVVFVRGISQWSCYEYWCPAHFSKNLMSLSERKETRKSAGLLPEFSFTPFTN
jgi:hypothetical protein